MTSQAVKQISQSTYCPIPKKAKATRQWNLMKFGKQNLTVNRI